MKIYYITGNKRKIQRAEKICKGSGVQIEQLKTETPEIQGKSSKEIAKFSANFAGKKLNKPIVKLDVSFHINNLSGFPGPFVKYVNEWLPPEKILKMLEGVKDRTCYWTDSLAFYYQGKTKVFSSNENGTLTKIPRGQNGWGMDKIFIPQGQDKTKAELSDEERLNICNQEHWNSFIKFIQKTYLQND